MTQPELPGMYTPAHPIGSMHKDAIDEDDGREIEDANLNASEVESLKRDDKAGA